MVPQGSAPLNSGYFTALIAQINAINTCSELQTLTNDAFASLAPIKTAINAEIASLMPALSLMTMPSADPTAIVSWIGNLITSVITPFVKPYQTYMTQLTQLTQDIAMLSAAIAAAEARMTSCTISIPAI